MTPETKTPVAPSDAASPAPQPLEIDRINWKTTLFLASTLLIALVGTPLYILRFGFGWMEGVLFFAMTTLTGMSITVGYHRLFTHRSFDARWPVRLGTLLFGAAAFEMPALWWAAEHRYHHKYTDQDGDPHDPHSIERGFFWAHVGWMLVYVRPELRYTNVDDLRRDPLVVWQERFYIPIAVTMGFLLPMAAGALWAAASGVSIGVGLLAGFLVAGCARIAFVHHLTFFINSLAHTWGKRPYDGEASSRDSGLLAFLTFGEGYHNFHHAFQTDYRNGIRPWHFDPGKWAIWTMAKLGLVTRMRRVPEETIRLARLKERRRRLEERLAHSKSELRTSLETWMNDVEARLDELHLRLRSLRVEYAKSAREKLARPRLTALRAELRQLRREFRANLRIWQLAARQARVLA